MKNFLCFRCLGWWLVFGSLSCIGTISVEDYNSDGSIMAEEKVTEDNGFDTSSQKSDPENNCIQTIQVNRQNIPVEVLFVIETRNYFYGHTGRYKFACAMGAFFDALESQPVKIGITTADVSYLYDYNQEGQCGECAMTSQVDLVTTSKDCMVDTSCSDTNSYELCELADDEEMLDSNDPITKNEIIKRFMLKDHCAVMSNDNWPSILKLNMCATDLEVAFRYAFDQYKEKNICSVRHIVVFAADILYAEEHICNLQKKRREESYLNELRQVLGNDFDPPESELPPSEGDHTWCADSLSLFYGYFFKRLGVRIHVFAPVVDWDDHQFFSREKTAKISGGQFYGNLMNYGQQIGYGDLVDGLWNIGTQIKEEANTDQSPVCLPDNLSEIASIEVYFMDGENRLLIPESKDNGWAWVPNSLCLSLSGEWNRLGPFEIEVHTQSCPDSST